MPGVGMIDRDTALTALHSLNPGCPREQWVRVAMGAKHAGLSLADFTEWSHRLESPTMADRANALATTRSTQ